MIKEKWKILNKKVMKDRLERINCWSTNKLLHKVKYLLNKNNILMSLTLAIIYRMIPFTTRVESFQVVSSLMLTNLKPKTKIWLHFLRNLKVNRMRAINPWDNNNNLFL